MLVLKSLENAIMALTHMPFFVYLTTSSCLQIAQNVRPWQRLRRVGQGQGHPDAQGRVIHRCFVTMQVHMLQAHFLSF